MPTNVAEISTAEARVARTVDTYGGPCCASNNAGILPPTRPFAEQDKATFDKGVAVDLQSVFLCLKY